MGVVGDGDGVVRFWRWRLRVCLRNWRRVGGILKGY